MINEDNGFIFIHNPKTGGSSVKQYLHNLNLSFKKGDWHYSIKQLRGFTDRDNTDYFKFGTCRNPFSRLVSAFTYNCRNCVNPNNYHWKSYPDSYPILKKWTNHNNGDLINNFRYFVASKDFDKIFDRRWPVHFYPQSKFLKPKDVDLLIRFENLQEGFREAITRIGIENSAKLPLVNSSNHVHYKEFYDIQTMDIVSKKYREDFTVFGYDPLFLE